MVIKKGAAKRKMNEAEETPQSTTQINLFNLSAPTTQLLNTPVNITDAQESQIQRSNLTGALSPFRPFVSNSWGAFNAFSSTSFAADSFKTRSDLNEINTIITSHGENLRHALEMKLAEHHAVLGRAAEERATKKLRERESELQTHVSRTVELEQMAAHYKMEAGRVEERIIRLEEMTGSLQSRLQNAVAARPRADAESSFVDPDSVNFFRPLECKLCKKSVASVMVLPCRHVCICKACDAATHACPICSSVKTEGIEVLYSS